MDCLRGETGGENDEERCLLTPKLRRLRGANLEILTARHPTYPTRTRSRDLHREIHFVAGLQNAVLQEHI